MSVLLRLFDPNQAKATRCIANTSWNERTTACVDNRGGANTSRIRNGIRDVSRTQQNTDSKDDCTKDGYTTRNEINNADVNNTNINKHFSCNNIL